MAIAISDQDLSDEVQREQGEFDALVKKVQAMFHHGPSSRAVRAAKLVDMLDELLEHLGMVFALKESDGYLDEAVLAAPQLSRQANDLKDQHGALFRALCRLLDQCDRDLRRRHWHSLWSRDERRFADFCRQLRAHQAVEAHLVQQAFTEDVGVGD